MTEFTKIKTRTELSIRQKHFLEMLKRGHLAAIQGCSIIIGGETFPMAMVKSFSVSIIPKIKFTPDTTAEKFKDAWERS